MTITDWWTVAAAWVQAVGSVAAIFAAIWIANAETRRRNTERRQERIDFISLVQGVAALGHLHVRQTAALIRNEDVVLQYRSFDESESDSLAAVLMGFDRDRLGSPPGAIGIVHLARACEKTPGFAHAAGKLLHQEGACWLQLEDSIDEWEAAALEAYNAIMAMTP